jgi:hypothetical protein
MSFRHFGQVWGIRGVFAAKDKLLMLAIAESVDDYGVCIRSVVDLAEVSDLSDREVLSALEALDNSGFVEITHTQFNFPRGIQINLDTLNRMSAGG